MDGKEPKKRAKEALVLTEFQEQVFVAWSTNLEEGESASAPGVEASHSQAAN